MGGEVLRQYVQHQVSRTPTVHRREDTAAEEGTAAAARSKVANRGANITRGRANVRGDAKGGPGDGKLESAGRWLTLSRATQTGRPHPRTRRSQAFPRHYRPCLERGGNPTGVERRNDQGAPQEVGPIRLQQLPRDFTRLPRRQSTVERRSSAASGRRDPPSTCCS